MLVYSYSNVSKCMKGPKKKKKKLAKAGQSWPKLDLCNKVPGIQEQEVKNEMNITIKT